jgi:hypothetical protein
MTQQGPKHVGGKLCTLRVIPQHSVLVGAVSKFLQYTYDYMQNEIYLKLLLFGLKQTDK